MKLASGLYIRFSLVRNWWETTRGVLRNASNITKKHFLHINTLLIKLVSIQPVNCRINHLQDYCTATKQYFKRCQPGKGGLLHSSEIKALYRAEKAILLSLLRSSSAASCHSLRAFLSMISIYRTQEVLHRLWEVSLHQVPEPSRTKSLSCHLRLHAVPTITHITASMNKRHQSERDAKRMYIRQLHSHLIGLITGEKKQWSLQLIIQGDRPNYINSECILQSLQFTCFACNENRKYSRVGNAFHIAAKHPWILKMPANLKALVEKGKELEGWTSADDIVREMEDEGRWHCREKGGRRMMIKASKKKQICWKHVCTVNAKQLQCTSYTFPLHLQASVRQLNVTKHALTWNVPPCSEVIVSGLKRGSTSPAVPLTFAWLSCAMTSPRTPGVLPYTLEQSSTQ